MTETLAFEPLAVESENSGAMRQLAHDLRQPLSAIESIAYYLDLVLPAGEDRARVQVDRLKRMVEQSHWIVSNAVQAMQSAPLSPQLLELRELLASAECESGCSSQVEYDLGSPGPLIRLDPGRAVHLFYSLFGLFRNIATPSAPLRVSAIADEFRTEVKFECHPESAVLPPGYGLSLTSAQKIVEAHQGSFQVLKDSAGFAVTLAIPL